MADVLILGSGWEDGTTIESWDILYFCDSGCRDASIKSMSRPEDFRVEVDGRTFIMGDFIRYTDGRAVDMHTRNQIEITEDSGSSSHEWCHNCGTLVHHGTSDDDDRPEGWCNGSGEDCGARKSIQPPSIG